MGVRLVVRLVVYSAQMRVVQMELLKVAQLVAWMETQKAAHLVV